MPPGIKRGQAGDHQTPSKRSKRSVRPVTMAEMDKFIPSEIKEYVRSAKVASFHQKAIGSEKHTHKFIQDRDEYMRRLQVLFAFLFHRCTYYPEAMLQLTLSIVRPPNLRSSLAEQAEAQKSLEDLYGTIMVTHMRLTSHFLDHTQYGSKHWAELARCRTSKLKLPILESPMVAEALDIPAVGLQAVWFPLTAVAAPGTWEPKKCPDGEQWETHSQSDTPTLARFRLLSAEIVIKMVRVWAKANESELSSHAQLAILKEFSIADAEWPEFNPTGKHLNHFRKGTYAPQKVMEFIEKGLKSRVQQAQTSPKETDSNADPETEADTSDAAAELAETDIDGQADGTADVKADGNLKADGKAEGKADDKADGEGDGEADGDADSDVSIGQDDEPQPSTKVVGRPMTFGSEFPETGGTCHGRSVTCFSARHPPQLAYG
jgi:hypothetical protein